MTTLAQHVLDMSHHSSFHEIANAEAGSIDFTTTNSTTGVLIPGMQFTIAAGDLRPYRVRFGGCLYAGAVGASPYFDLYEDGIQIARAGLTVKAANFVSFRRGQRRRLVPIASHSYELRLTSGNGATVHALSTTDPAGGATPVWMQAVTG